MSFGTRLRSLASDAAVYGLSNVIGRFLNFLLLPLYTNVLKPHEFGPVQTLYAYIALCQVLWLVGLDSAYLRFAAHDEKRDERTVFSTAALTVTAAAVLFSTTLALLSDPIAALVGLDGHGDYVRAAAGILVLDALAALPLAYLRLRRRPMAFALVRLTSIGTNIGLALLFLLHLEHGAFGILEANLAASALTVVLLLPIYERLLRPALLERRLLGAIFRFSLPLVPAGLAAQVVQVADRPILQLLTDDAAVGVYSANYKLGVVMMLFVTVFQYAWQPFFLLRGNDADARPLFARVLTYYFTAAMALFLGVTLLVDRIVAFPVRHHHTLIAREYWSGTAVVPWVLLGYVLLGVYTNLTAGPTLAKQTRVFPWVTAMAALTNVLGNLILVPRHGIVAAGFTTFLAYLVMAVAMWWETRRIYPVPYEWWRLGRAAAIGLGIWGAFVLLGGERLGLANRGALLALYPALLVATGFIARDERAAIARRLAAWRR